MKKHLPHLLLTIAVLYFIGSIALNADPLPAERIRQELPWTRDLFGNPRKTIATVTFLVFVASCGTFAVVGSIQAFFNWTERDLRKQFRF